MDIKYADAQFCNPEMTKYEIALLKTTGGPQIINHHLQMSCARLPCRYCFVIKNRCHGKGCKPTTITVPSCFTSDLQAPPYLSV